MLSETMKGNMSYVRCLNIL